MVAQVNWTGISTEIQWLVDFGTRYSFADNHFTVVGELADRFVCYGFTPVLYSYEYNGSILYSSKEGVFYYDDKSVAFKKDSVLSTLFGGEKYLSGKMINDKTGNKLWGFSKNEIIYVEPGKLSDEPEVNVIAISSEMRKSKSGFENILHIDDNSYLIGTTHGYLIIDTNKLEQNSYLLLDLYYRGAQLSL